MRVKGEGEGVNCTLEMANCKLQIANRKCKIKNLDRLFQIINIIKRCSHPPETTLK
jgi:hypothetical protein